jgi:anti-sigma factor RsiW
MHDLSIECERARLQASLAADREISELEQTALQAHTDACPACADYARNLRQMVQVLRETPAAAVEPLRLGPERSRRRIHIIAAAAAVIAALAAGSLAGTMTRGGNGTQHVSQADTHRLQIQQSLLALASAARPARTSGHGSRVITL